MGWTTLRVALIGLCALAATWITATAPRACPAVFPTPEECLHDPRLDPAAHATGLVAGITAGALVAAALAPALRPVLGVLVGMFFALIGIGAPLWVVVVAHGNGTPSIPALLLVVALLVTAVVAEWSLVQRARRSSTVQPPAAGG